VFDVSFVVNAVNGNVTKYNVKWNGNTWGPFNYGEVVTIPNLPANGTNIVLVVSDPINGSCQTTISVSQFPCSSCPEKVDAGPPFVLDCIVKTAVLQATSTILATYSWKGPNKFSSTLINPTVSIPGTYFITADFGKLCKDTDSTKISLDASVPFANAGPDKLLTCVVKDVLLDGTLSSTNPSFVFEWTDVTGNLLGNGKTLLVNKPGQYYLTVIDKTNNCSSPPSLVTVNENINQPTAPILADPGEILNCNVDVIILSTTAQQNVVFKWEQNGKTTNGLSLTINKGGLVTLTALDTISKCSETNTILIQELIEYPIANVLPPAKITCKNPQITIDASGSQKGPNITYQWLDGNKNVIPNQTTAKLVVSAAGTYYFKIEDINIGCINIDTILVISDVKLPVVNAGADQNLACFVTETTLNGSYSNASSNTLVVWTTTSGNILGSPNELKPKVTGESWYVLNVTDNETGCSNKDSVYIKLNADAPVIDAVKIDSVKCFGEKTGKIVITKASGGTPPIQYFINGSKNPNTTGEFSPLYSGSYTIIAKDAIGCESSKTLVVGEGKQIKITLEPSILIKLGDEAWLEALVNIPLDQISKIIWTPGKDLSCDSCLITKVKTLSPQQFQITVQDKDGCSAQDYIIVFVNKDVNVFIPNVFSPNGDNTNDNFTLFADDRVVKINQLKIFDRWGGMMYQNSDFAPNDPSLGWDGFCKGKPVNPGVYVYYFIIEFIDGRQEIFKGDITVVRN
jgi:gliding motility-associated-like protein